MKGNGTYSGTILWGGESAELSCPLREEILEATDGLIIIVSKYHHSSEQTYFWAATTTTRPAATIEHFILKMLTT